MRDSIRRARRIGRHGHSHSHRRVAQHGRHHPRIGEPRIELDGAIEVTNARRDERAAGAEVAEAAVGLEEGGETDEVVRVAQRGVIVGVGRDAQEAFARERHAVFVVADDGVVEHRPREREVAIGGVRGAGDDEKEDEQNVSHARNVGGAAAFVLRIA